MTKEKRAGRAAIRIFVLLLIFTFVLSEAPAFSDMKAEGTVRVRLDSLGSPLSIQVTLLGGYRLNGTTFSDGTDAKVSLNSATGRITLVTGSRSVDCGTAFTLERAGESSGARIARARVPSNVYPGDLTFISEQKNGFFRMTCTVSVPLESYVYGVIAYEMGDSFPVEALKAQAVVCRTYALRKMRDNAQIRYDVVDTTSDQVYNGTPSERAHCLDAQRQTAGQALVYNGSWAAAFYTASNGGQTESAFNAWGSRGCDYLTVKEDPWDLLSDAKCVSFPVYSDPDKLSGTLSGLLNKKLCDRYGNGASLATIYDVSASVPLYAAPSRLYTRLTFYVTYTSGKQVRYGELTFSIFDELESPLSMNLSSGKSELWSVESIPGGFRVLARRYGHGIGMSQHGARQMALSGMICRDILHFYYEGCELTGSGASSGPASPAEMTDASLTGRVNTASGSLNLRRTPGGTVLRTVPRGEVIPLLSREGSWYFTRYKGTEGYVSDSFVTVLSTPGPGSDPVTARVNTASGSLNLRSRASSSAGILRTIPKGKTVTVLSRDGEWSRVSYLGSTGYVMTCYLGFDPAQPTVSPKATPSPVPAKTPAVTPAGKATPTPVPSVSPLTESLFAVTVTVSGSLNLREGPDQNSRVLLEIPHLARVPIFEKGPLWCRVSYGGKNGYVMTAYLAFESALPLLDAVTPSPAAPRDATLVSLQQPVNGYVASKNGSLNLRSGCSTSSSVQAEIPRYTCLQVTGIGKTWCRVRYGGREGFCMRKYISFTEP